MEDNNFRRISFGDSEGISNSPDFETSSMAQASDQDQILGTTIVTIPGHIGSGFEGSSTSGCRTEGPVPFNIVHSTAGEQEPTSFQAEDIEQICPHRKVQTRKFGPTKNNVETERLSNETGPEGCV